MKRYLLCLVLALAALATAMPARAQSLYFPPLTGSTWDTIQPSSLGWCQPGIDSLYDYLELRNSKAFILLQDGKIVLEKYFGTFTVDSLWYWASAGKTLTGFTVGIAQQEGHLSISDTTSQYLGAGWTSLTPAQEQRITIRHQLTMTTGLDDLTHDVYCTDDTCLTYLADPGTRWAYHNGPYTLLDGVIEAATGMPLNTYITQKIKTPTGLDGFFLKIGYNNVYFSKARGFARFGLLLLNRGTWNTTPVLTDTAYFHAMTNTSQNLNESYGYLTWLNGKSSYMVPYVQFQIPGSLNPNAPADMFLAAGKNGQLLNVVPSQNRVWLRMGNEPIAGDVPVTMNDTVWQFLNRLGCGPTAATPAAPQPAFAVAPNPALEQVTLTLAQPAAPDAVVEVVNAQGQVALQLPLAAGTKEVRLQLPTALARGMYLVRLRTGGSAVSRRLLLQ